MPVQCGGLIFAKQLNGDYQVTVGENATDNTKVERVVLIPAATWAAIAADAVGTARQKLSANSVRHGGNEF